MVINNKWSRVIRVRDLMTALKIFERSFIEQALENNYYDKKKTAKELGITLDSLYYRLHKYNIDTKTKENEYKMKLIYSAIKKFNGNKARAGRWLGIPRSTLYVKLKEYEERKKGGK